MDVFEIADLEAARRRSGRLYHEFLHVPALSAGVYTLPAGGTDPQRPHREAEVYYVVSGRGAVRIGDADRPVQAGTVVFVPAGVEHRFHGIKEELTLLVL